ncbi:hypothetical protein ANME2D_03071 [Candidatus Methanoperedens nitroreducens]|uniref:Uncharacterized protein n=1 Tax=Candidatus Methanoperedens nitratireducens TaxID=1392998 RepID=A0A062UVJ3_9EURY|nr:hypothetical protein ANME2D_03071 [Candidatus Methanoperedens nitroreducens]
MHDGGINMKIWIILAKRLRKGREQNNEQC